MLNQWKPQAFIPSKYTRYIVINLCAWCIYTAADSCLCLQGYDMEDAMILNKGSVERGFKHATVYKSEVTNAGMFPHWSVVVVVVGTKPPLEKTTTS